MGQWKVFDKELSYIKNEKIKEFTVSTLKKVPAYFYEIPASSTGKYHSKFCLGEGGLVKHTKVAVRIAADLLCLEMFNSYNSDDKDIMLSALILHDTMKSGIEKSQYTLTEHPNIICEFICNDNELSNIVDTTILAKILGCIASHMGQWNTDYKTKKEVLNKPKTKMEHFVHLCDYLASRKYFEEFNFDVEIVRK